METPAEGGHRARSCPSSPAAASRACWCLGRRRGRRHEPFRPAEVKWLSVIASRAALALENSFYLKELVATERVAALGTMASMLAHDFRGPMTVIRGYAETLLDPTLPAEEVRARAELIVSNVDRLERMTEETLDFARGGGRLARGAGAPVRLPPGPGGGPGPGAARASRSFPTSRCPASARGGLDVDKVRRAVSNIAANASGRDEGPGPPPRSRRRSRTANLVLVVADEGPGVPEEVKGRIFEPFATYGKKKGTGLGLAVAQRFVEDHGGRVELLSGPFPPASGAAFRLVLPLAGRKRRPRRTFNRTRIRGGAPRPLPRSRDRARSPPRARRPIPRPIWGSRRSKPTGRWTAPRGDTQYLAPVVRFRLYNKTSRTLRAVDAQAAFARVGERTRTRTSGPPSSSWSPAESPWPRVPSRRWSSSPRAATPCATPPPRTC